MAGHSHRWLLVVVTFLAAAMANAGESSLRVVFVHEDELLKSESRAIGELCTRLKKRHLQTSCAEPSADETAAARALFAGQAATLPEAWKSASAVVAFEILSPSKDKKGKRFTSGWKSLVFLRPPSPKPLWIERSDEKKGELLYGDDRLEKIVALGAP